MDETPLPVRENKKVTGHDSYIWAVHNGHTETIKASYFWFGDGRDSSNVTNIIESICKDDFNIDSLLADGFTGYPQKSVVHNFNSTRSPIKYAA